MEGWMKKQGGAFHSQWQQRYCVLEGEGLLKYYTTHTKENLRGIIDVHKATIIPDGPTTFYIEGPNVRKAKKYKFSVASKGECNAWVSSLKKAATPHLPSIHQSLSQPPTQPPPLPNNNETADQYIQQLTRAIEQNKNDADAYFNRGVAKSSYLQEYEGALQDWSTALTLNPAHADAYFNRGVIKKMCFNDIEGALQDYNHAIHYNPVYGNAYMNRGNIKKNFLEDWEGALQDYNKAIEVNPRQADAYTNRGNLKRNYLDDYQGALEDYNKAIEVNPKGGSAYFNRAALKRLVLSDYEGAVEDLTAVIELNPYDAEALTNRGIIKHECLNDFEGALADYNTALDCKHDPLAYVNRGRIKQHLNGLEAAKQDYEAALQLDPNCTTAEEHLQAVLEEMKECW
eukprot:TRINITY_DN94063_c0_g1_i1.p1 TRINITY_DN94063_c0_g1~~TRINITY_DN94063_c0_g1_i1.p1  ORF type:complete len:400 (-),score=40.92 TRINITY_DN94063_c0_g1_i1:753-1952(-)